MVSTLIHEKFDLGLQILKFKKVHKIIFLKCHLHV